MKYESNILKRLIDTYGVIGNPRYLSEIIKEFIVRGKELYPQLFTYQADWLAHIDEFGLTPEYVVSYTGQQIYAPHTKERPVKRAILKGNTLVNVVSSYWFGDRKNCFSVNLKQYKIGQSYIFIMFDVPSNTTEIYLGDANMSIVWSNYTNNFTRNKNSVMLKVTCPSNYDGSTILPHLKYLNNELPSSIGNIKCMLIEYQQGMENWDIPYFEGMQSVKTPVLTTSNEDGTKTNILTANEDVTLRGIGDVKDELNLLTGELTQNIAEAVLSTFESYAVSTSNGIYYMAKTKVANDISPSHTLIIGANKFISKIYSEGGENFKIQVSSKEDGTYPTRAELSEYLSQNPLILCYIPTTSTIKTVDLTILDQNGQNVEQLMAFNGGTHFNTTSSEGSPLPLISVDVVTDLEETLNLCSTDGNTL